MRVSRKSRMQFPATTCMIALALACSPANETPAADTAVSTARDTTQPAVPTSTAVPASPTATASGDTITPLLETGCIGGVTGGGSGTLLTSTGDFYRDQTGSPAPNARRDLTLLGRDSARASALVQAAEREGITRIKFIQPSNMTCGLSLYRGGTTYRVAWPSGTARPWKSRGASGRSKSSACTRR